MIAEPQWRYAQTKFRDLTLECVGIANSGQHDGFSAGKIPQWHHALRLPLDQSISGQVGHGNGYLRSDFGDPIGNVRRLFVTRRLPRDDYEISAANGVERLTPRSRRQGQP